MALLSSPNPSIAPDDPIRVMVVDDALVIRGLIARMLEAEPGIAIVASVGDGERAVAYLERNDVDVVVLDIEMPKMDGLTALPKLLALRPGLQVIMASTLTQRNAEISLKALQLGAAEYLPKPASSGELRSADDFKRELIDKVKALGRVAKRTRRRDPSSGQGTGPTSLQPAAARPMGARPPPLAKVSQAGQPPVLRKLSTQRPEIIAVGSSTGGPQALFKVMEVLGRQTQLPILITQHMPATFTKILAEHLTKASGRQALEGVQGEPIVPGRIYVAPGDWHMRVRQDGARRVIALDQEPPENFCRPAVDPMFRSLGDVYGARVLAAVLTGMGSDGARGAVTLADKGCTVVAQDEASSVVWGMPGATVQAGAAAAILPIEEIGPYMARLAGGRP